MIYYKCLYMIVLFCLRDAFGEYFLKRPGEAPDLESERIIHRLNKYISLQEESLSDVERLIHRLDELSSTITHSDVTSETSIHIQNHVIALTETLRDTIEEIQRFENVSMYDSVIGEIKDYYGDSLFDFDEEGFLRLQTIYNLRTDVLASGVLRKSYSLPLTALECMVLAQAAYRMGDHFLAAEWTTEAKHRAYTEAQPSVNIPTLLHTLAISASQANNPWAAAKLLVDLFEMLPDDGAANSQCEELLREITAAIYDVSTTEWVRIQFLHKERGRNTLPTLSRMCRGIYARNDSPSLKCSYSNLGDPWLIIHPVRLEVLSGDPALVLLHSVFTDHQLERLKHINSDTENRKQKLKDLLSLVAYGNDLMNFKFTVQKHSVTGDEAYPIHIKEDTNMANVMCPVMKYKSMDIFLSNVEGGGALIYPTLEKVIAPKKGNVVLLEYSGDVHPNHPIKQQCPLLLGDNWIFHAEYNQPVEY